MKNGRAEDEAGEAVEAEKRPITEAVAVEDDNCNVEAVEVEATLDDEEPQAKKPRLSVETPQGVVVGRPTTGTSCNWEIQFAKLKAWHAQHHHWNVPVKYPPDQKFSNWVRTQRDNHNYESRANISADRIARLNSLGFDWKTPQNRAPKKTFDEMVAEVVASPLRAELLAGAAAHHHARTVLGMWIQKQRQGYHKHLLGPEQVAKLEEIGLDWGSPDTAARSKKNRTKKPWSEQMKALQDYFEANGNSNVPTTASEHRSLRGWTVYQKRAFHSNLLSEEQIAQLHAVQFDFGPPPPKKREWNDLFQALELFVDKTGHANVPYNYATDPMLGRWVAVQRELYQQNILDEPRIQKLELVGFDFSLVVHTTNNKNPTWDEQFESLKKFRDEHQHTNPTSLYEPDPGLCLWAARQRLDKAKERLEPDKIQKLDGLHFDWTGVRRYKYTSEEIWRAFFRRLQAFQLEHGHCGTIDNFPSQDLMDWMNRQHVLYLKKRLNEEQIAQLESIGFAWRFDIEVSSDDDDDGDDDDNQKMPALPSSSSSSTKKPRAPRISWEMQYQYLLTFKEKYQNCNVPPEYDPKLAEWVKTQRKLYGNDQAKGTTMLLPKKVEKLNAIDFVWEEVPPMEGALLEGPRKGLKNNQRLTTATPVATLVVSTPTTANKNNPFPLTPNSADAKAVASPGAGNNPSLTDENIDNVTQIHRAAARTAGACSRALVEAKKHRTKLQKELNECRLELHRVKSSNQKLEKKLEEMSGLEAELFAQQGTIQSQAQQLEQLTQQMEEVRAAQTLLLNASHRPPQNAYRF